MKYWLYILAVMYFLASCNNTEKPEAVALHFIHAMQQEDFSTAKKYATGSSADLLDGLNTTKGKHLFPLKPDDVITVKQVMLKNDTCFILVTTQKKFPFKLILEKHYSGWQVVYDMQTLMKSAFDEAP